MTATIPTQEQVDQIARELAPDVVRIRFLLDEDWSGDPAIHFRIVLGDHLSDFKDFSAAADTVRDRLVNTFGLWEGERIPYFRFRRESQNAEFKDPRWA
jgi:hypothetical protein